MINNQINLDKENFSNIQKKIYKLTGINIEDNKRSMVKNRLFKLFQDTHCQSMDDLFKKIDSNKTIAQDFINIFTTNKTDFFREIFHFTDLLDRALPELMREKGHIKIYCCASSTGQEPYTIAMTAMYAQKIYNSSAKVEIIATDIDTSVLEIAKKGEYIINPKLEKWPNWTEDHMEDYFEVKDESKEIRHIKATQKLKSLITFRQMNLFAPSYSFSEGEFDIVFCRNVLIYFQKQDQIDILKKLLRTLRRGGTFYLGHSESMYELSDDFEKLGNKTFIKKMMMGGGAI